MKKFHVSIPYLKYRFFSSIEAESFEAAKAKALKYLEDEGDSWCNYFEIGISEAQPKKPDTPR